MNKAVDISFSFLILLWVLPSGTIMGFPVKIIAFAICAFFLILAVLSKGKALIYTKRITYLFFISITMFIWMIIAVVNGYTAGLIPMVKYVGPFIGTLILADLYFTNFSTEYSIRKLGRLIYISCIFFVSFKIIFEILLLLNILSYENLMFVFNDILSANVMTLQIPFGSVSMWRISTSNDLIPFTLLGFDLIFYKRNFLSRFITLLAAFFFSLITYSRLVFLHFVVIILCFVFYSFREYGRKRTTLIRLVMISILSLVIISVFLYQNSETYTTIQSYIFSRFDSIAVSDSDIIRNTQFGYLFNGFVDHPLFGNGFGSYVKGYIRSQNNIFSYELEYLSFLYQFGLIGFLLIIIGLISVAYSFMVNRTNFKEYKLFIIINFFLWVFKPFFNPYMFSSVSAMVIIESYLLPYYISFLKADSTS